MDGAWQVIHGGFAFDHRDAEAAGRQEICKSSTRRTKADNGDIMRFSFGRHGGLATQMHVVKPRAIDHRRRTQTLGGSF